MPLQEKLAQRVHLGRKKRVPDLARMSKEAYAGEAKMSEGQPVSAAVVKTWGNNQGMFIRNAGHVAEGGGKGGRLGITVQWSRSDHPRSSLMYITLHNTGLPVFESIC